MGATYDLGLIKSLVAQNRYLITRSALQTALEIGFDDADIVECIVEELAEVIFTRQCRQQRSRLSGFGKMFIGSTSGASTCT
jgi:hypothetical protein